MALAAHAFLASFVGFAPRGGSKTVLCAKLAHRQLAGQKGAVFSDLATVMLDRSNAQELTAPSPFIRTLRPVAQPMRSHIEPDPDR